MTTRFERDTSVERLDDEMFTAMIDRAWWVLRGPNGGYLAAIILRAMDATVDDPARVPRSVTVHYTSSPGEGEVTIRTRRERVGRSLTSVSARMEQEGALVAVAMAAFSTSRPGPEFCDVVMPEVPAPAAVGARGVPDLAPPFAHRWDLRWAIGRAPDPTTAGAPPPPADGVREAVAGGWIRLEEPQVLDAPAVAAITDAWVPPVFSRTNTALAVPTIDLTIHFRTSLPLPGATPDDYLLAVFRTNAAAEGFLEEDGEVWSADGRLVAQSRQLAVTLPLTPSS